MLRVSTLFSVPGAVTASLALHAGMATWMAGHTWLETGAARGAQSIDIEMIAGPEPDTTPAPVDDAVRAPEVDTTPARSLRATRVESARAAALRHGSPAGPAAAIAVEPTARFEVGVISSAPRFVLAATRSSETRDPTALPGSGGDASGTDDITRPANRVSVPARLLVSAPIAYPSQARAADIEASVPLEIVVDTQGRVVDARPLFAVGYGFDAAALQAIRAYRFAPAQHLGRAVRVRMRWSVQFRLR